MTWRGLGRNIGRQQHRLISETRAMQDPHPTSRSRAPVPLAFVGAAPRGTRRARVRPAVTVGYDRLAAAFPHPSRVAAGGDGAGGGRRRFCRGETFVREGNPADRFYIVSRGAGRGDAVRRRGGRARVEDAGRRLLRRGRAARDEDADGDGAGGQRGPGRGSRPRAVPGARGRVGVDRGEACTPRPRSVSERHPND